MCWGVNCDFVKCSLKQSVLSSWEAKCSFWVKCSLKQSVCQPGNQPLLKTSQYINFQFSLTWFSAYTVVFPKSKKNSLRGPPVLPSSHFGCCAPLSYSPWLLRCNLKSWHTYIPIRLFIEYLPQDYLSGSLFTLNLVNLWNLVTFEIFVRILRPEICIRYFLTFPQKNLSQEKTETK